MLGSAKDLTIAFKIGDGLWWQYSAVPGQPLAQGDGGTYRYDTAGHWVTVSTSSGCSGCVVSFNWSVKSGVLTLRTLDQSGGNYTYDVRFVTEGKYRRGR